MSLSSDFFTCPGALSEADGDSIFLAGAMFFDASGAGEGESWAKASDALAINATSDINACFLITTSQDSQIRPGDMIVWGIGSPTLAALERALAQKVPAKDADDSVLTPPNGVRALDNRCEEYRRGPYSTHGR